MSPPPGVSSTSISPPIASTKPLATASPSPTPSPCAESPSRWNGRKSRSRSSRGTPGPRSTTRTSTMPSTTPAVTRGERRAARSGRRSRSRWRARARAGRGRPAHEAATRGRRARRSRRHPRLRSAAGSTSSRPTGDGADLQRASLEPAHVEQVADERVEPVGLLVDRARGTPAAHRASIRRPAGAGSSPRP